MGSLLNNRLLGHLSDVSRDPLNRVLAQNSGPRLDISHINSNQMQTLLSPQSQHAATTSIANLPPEQQQSALQGYSHLIGGLKDALSSSINEVFIVSGIVVSVAFFAAWLLKEIPLQGRAGQPLISGTDVPGGHSVRPRTR